MKRTLILILVAILLSSCSGLQSSQLTSTQTATLNPTLHPSVTPFSTPTKTATLEPTNTIQPTKEKTHVPDAIFANFIKYGYDEQFKEGLGIINNEKGSYMVEMVSIGKIQYSQSPLFDIGNLEVYAYVQVAWFDRDGNKQAGVLPFTYLNKMSMKVIQGCSTSEVQKSCDLHQYYLLGYGFDEKHETPFIGEKFLSQRFDSYLKNQNQIISAYYDATETTFPGLAGFLQGLPALSAKFVETGDSIYLPNVPDIGPVFPITSIGFVQ